MAATMYGKMYTLLFFLWQSILISAPAVALAAADFDFPNVTLTNVRIES
jgi:hypothetical protein